MKPSKEQIKQWHNDPKNWKFQAIYYNPEDPRAWVNKRIEWMGWTVNFANRKGVFSFILLTVFIILMLIYSPTFYKA